MTLPKQSVLDEALVLVEPIQVGIQIVLIEGFEVQHVAGGMGAGQPHGGQPRALIDDPRQDLPESPFGVL